MKETTTEKGLLAIRLVRFALAKNSELQLEDEHNQQIRRAWQLGKKLLSAEEIEAFGELLRHYADE